MKAMAEMASRKEKGFTLIELVMVIVILGILAAFALPRFANLGGEARGATLEGAAGSVKSAAAIVNSKWRAAGEPTGDITMEDGTAVTMNAAGYPTADADGIMKAAQLDTTADFEINSGVIKPNGYTDTDVNNDGTSGDCEFTYSGTTGKVTGLVTADCI